MMDQDILELALFRALRGAVPPSVRGIVAEVLQPHSIALRIFVYGPIDQLSSFEEEIESEFDQSLPKGMNANVLLTCAFEPGDTFPVSEPARVVYDNPWAVSRGH